MQKEWDVLELVDDLVHARLILHGPVDTTVPVLLPRAPCHGLAAHEVPLAQHRPTVPALLLLLRWLVGRRLAEHEAALGVPTHRPPLPSEALERLTEPIES